MKLIVDIREKDIEALKNKVMTIEAMDNTLEGRIICAIVHAALYTPYKEGEELQEARDKYGIYKI